MRFKSIHIKEGYFERYIVFSENNNLIYSEKNSTGKTSLLRILLYSIGYSIPNTKNIKFENCIVTTQIEENGRNVVLIRSTREYIVMNVDGNEETFILPSQEHNLHKKLFLTENVDLLNNILGAFYFDQEKGWTLLNRGIVIGSIRYNIEELIRGINNFDCSELVRQKERKSQDLLKYKQMFSVSKYQEAINMETSNLASESFDTTTESKINQCKIQQNILKKELQQIERALRDNQKIKKFIADIGLLVQLPNGETIAVTDENIVGLNDSIYYLIAKKKIIAADYNKISLEIKEIEKEQRVEEIQLSFFDDVETIAEIFDKRIATIPINALSVEKKIHSVEKEINDINCQIKDITRNATTTITNIFNNTRKYLNELDLDGDAVTEKYLFTSNLKELSGAILHKTVFAFRLACLIEIERTLNIKLPIILDSPSGKEVDPENIKKMINILNRDFAENQIIIASIFEYDLNNIHKIEIKDRLIDTIVKE